MTPPTEYQLLELLQDFAQASDRYVEAAGTRHKIHRTDMNALAVIIKYDRAATPLPARQLGSELELSAPATSALLDRLERLGLATRAKSPDDRRAITILPTPHARSQGREMFAPLAATMLQALAGHSSQERELLCGFLAKAIAATNQARDDVARDDTISPPPADC